MIGALLSRLPSRLIFVAGKGGVGKTTTAGALALAFADRPESTHLISTDPAHSIGDLFDQDLSSGAVMPSRCNSSLVLEEFDAHAYADSMFARMRSPLIELIERGTYLDEVDAAQFLDLSIPGIDELMAALRLVDLHASGVGRVIVDTAPTGHTIRLLESAYTMDSWVKAGRAMAEKAGVVASHLMGATVRLPAEAILDEWWQRARSFREEVLANAQAVVVTRSGHVIDAETKRLRADIAQRGLAVGAIVSVGPAVDADFEVEIHTVAPGCDGLRAWRSHVSTASAAAVSVAREPAGDAPAPAWVRDLGARLVLVAGKGGVGKSTCACALAAGVAQHRTVCVVSTDPAGSLSEVMGVNVGSEATEVAPNLFARQIDAVLEFERLRDQYQSSVETVFEALGIESAVNLDRKVVAALWEFAPPGIDEVMSLIEVLEQRDEYDMLIVDSAPTGHFLRLIQMPEIALEWVHALLRLLVKYGAVASLDALAHDLLALAKRLRQLKLDLSAPGTTAVFLITLDEPLVRAETARLLSALERASLPLVATIQNRADAGSPAGLDTPRDRSIRAPDQGHEVIGPAALRSFLAQWETTFNGE